ncbi:MAG: hypothetical protein R2705_24670 [Ilumatobacteraceae bacterium]
MIFAVDSVPAVLGVSRNSSWSSRRTPSPSSVCERCTSCSPTYTLGSPISSRDSRSSSPSSGSR